MQPVSNNTYTLGTSSLKWKNVYATTFNGDLSGNATTATTATTANQSSIAGDGTCNIIPQYSNEINFGGTNTSTTIYFGYRAADSRPIPTNFIFGDYDGSATVKASGFLKKGSSDNYVLLGGGGHKLESSLSVNYASNAEYASYASSAGDADSVDGQHFNWNNNKNNHTYLWAASSNGQAYLVHRASMSVNYASSAGNADTVDTYHISVNSSAGNDSNTIYFVI